MKVKGWVMLLLVAALLFAIPYGCDSGSDEEDPQAYFNEDDDDDDDDDDTVDDDDDDVTDDDDSTVDYINVTGNAFGFPDYERIVGAEIRILEFPKKIAITIADGKFEFSGLPKGQEATFVLTDPNDKYVSTQTRTFTLPDNDLERVTFQVPDKTTFTALALSLLVIPNAAKCQMVTTVTRYGKSIYDEGAHGEEGAIVTSEPEIPALRGPVYFNSNVMPDRDLDWTSDDGGVVYTNVEPGEYVLKAEKAGIQFDFPKMKCVAGMLVNASPPYGIQSLTPPEE